MNTPRKRKQAVQTASAKRRAHPLPTLALPSALALFAKSFKKVRFPDRETAQRGFRVLYRSGSIQAFGNYTFGCSSQKQFALLNKKGIRHEIVA